VRFGLGLKWSRTVAIYSISLTIHLTTRDIPGGKGRPACETHFTNICEPNFYRKRWSVDVSQPYEPPRSVRGIALPLLTARDPACAIDIPFNATHDVAFLVTCYAASLAASSFVLINVILYVTREEYQALSN
jgi:hypothetical protein